MILLLFKNLLLTRRLCFSSCLARTRTVLSAATGRLSSSSLNNEPEILAWCVISHYIPGI